MRSGARLLKFVLATAIGVIGSGCGGGGDSSKPPALSDLYGLLTLNYSLGPSSYSDRVRFSSADLSADGTSLTDVIIGSSSRLISCSITNSVPDRSFLCGSISLRSSDVEIWVFKLSSGVIVAGEYEYCLSSWTFSRCALEVLANPDSKVTGGVDPLGDGAPHPSSISTTDDAASKRSVTDDLKSSGAEKSETSGQERELLASEVKAVIDSLRSRKSTQQ